MVENEDNRIRFAVLLLQYANRQLSFAELLSFLREWFVVIGNEFEELEGVKLELITDQAGKPTKKGKLWLSFWGLDVHNKIILESGCPSEIWLTGLDGFGPQHPPIWNYTLSRLWINLPPISHEEQFAWLFSQPFPLLESLKVEGGQLSGKNLVEISDGRLPSLKTLSFRDCSLDLTSYGLVFLRLSNSLRKLTLTSIAHPTPSTKEQGFLFEGSLHSQNSPLEELGLINCGLGKFDLLALLSWKGKKLQHLDISSNSFHEWPLEQIDATNSIFLRLKEFWVCDTGIEKMVVNWMLENATWIAVRRVFAIMNERDLQFESQVVNHPNYSKFESIVLWWDYI